jgi:hypothetical protein
MSLAAQWLTEEVNACIVRYAPLIKAKAKAKNDPDLVPILRELAKDITSLAVEGVQRTVRENADAQDK